jgi:SAM-dependent methyltransferase
VSTFDRDWRRRFESYGSRHQADHLVSGWSAIGLRRRLEIFEGLLDAGLLAAGSRVLELGCGAGSYVRLLAKHGHRPVGLDYSLPSVSRALGADPAGTGRYLAGDAYRLPFAEGTFDGVLCIGVLQALSDPDGALGEMARVLGPGGRLLVEALNPWSPKAAALRMAATMRGRSTRLRYVSPAAVREVLQVVGIHVLRRVPVLVPPRSARRLVALTGRPSVARIVEAVPPARTVLSHAFWVVGAKP